MIVLFPSCNRRGYDLIPFAQAGAASVTGLELADTALRTATQYISDTAPGAGVAAGVISVHQGDFFKWRDPVGVGFDVGFDYTFMCAMHPKMRSDWAAAWAQLLAPGGSLITLIWPTDLARKPGPPGIDGGPPFLINPDIARQYLLPAGQYNHSQSLWLALPHAWLT